ncbi:aminotransferase class V-fold PLP-dependent enzyme [Mycoplasmopsis felifaucium]|uniref:aminotransferase class V-fold PLP-dependent enzyme n=1 Tax=Mycoplasmopsis felifaucium TaxID=35768 RepID=UPI0004847865|nr:aminotransferase class V-fold PLP-dependent enzyme [Mycoplasmopsis felifaucium]
MKNIREDFNILKNITYLDSAALVLKPNAAIEASNDFYLNNSISTRTSDSPIGVKISKVVDDVRSKIASLVDANPSEVIYTSGTTDSLNRIASMLKGFLKPGDEILLSPYNHSSNFAPWVEIANETGAKVVVDEDLINAINEKTKIVAYAQINNNFNIKFDEKLYKTAKKYNTILINDAAQAISFEKVSLKNCDVIAFSANKMYGPTGLGALIIKEELLNKLTPSIFGGGAIANIDNNSNVILQCGIKMFEPGTLNLAGIYMFNASLDYIAKNIHYNEVQKYLSNLSEYAYKKLSEVENITIYSNQTDHIILFNIGQYNSQDIAHYLGQNDVYVRSGVFCAQYLKNIKLNSSYVRVSLAPYNNKSDIDKLVDLLKKGGSFLVF